MQFIFGALGTAVIRADIQRFPFRDTRSDQGRPRILRPAIGNTTAEIITENYIDQEFQAVGRPGLDPGTLGLKVPCSSR